MALNMTMEINVLLDEYEELKLDKKDIDARLREVTDRLKQEVILAHQTQVGEEWDGVEPLSLVTDAGVLRVSVKTQNRVDVKILREMYPDVAEECMVESHAITCTLTPFRDATPRGGYSEFIK